MKTRKRYKISVEDESRLENIASFSTSSTKWLLFAVAAFCIAVFFGAAVVVFSPLRSLLPGYMKEAQRTATQIQLMRIDSLRDECEVKAAYLDNIISALNPQTARRDSSSLSFLNVPLTPDSLLPSSPEEERFVARMTEREKYNIAVMAPLAAETLMFSPLNGESVFSESTRSSRRGEIITAKGSPLTAIGDGRVIAVSQSMRDGGASVIIQHQKGFLSRCSRLGKVIVEPGDEVTGGQVIAFANTGNGRKGEIVYIEMWHNGLPLIPYEYIGGSGSLSKPQPVIDKDVGRGRL